MAPRTIKEGGQMAFKERVFSGVQPTGNLHLGNYLGAITKFVALQDRYDCIYCVVDLHAITVWQDPSELPRATREVTAAFLACGIDPKKNIIFNQSQVAEHAELAWVFNCVARVGWLNRMTQFKEKAGKDRENASVGLYVYPNLMAADILVYHATHVPVVKTRSSTSNCRGTLPRNSTTTSPRRSTPMLRAMRSSRSRSR
jgi:tryptophanyl-tRNA synthetase